MASRRRLNRTRRRRVQLRTYIGEMHRCRCGKVRGADREDAQRKHALARARNGWMNEVRFYACEFGGWHWTSRLDGSACTKAPRRFAAPGDGLTPDQRRWMAEFAEDAA